MNNNQHTESWVPIPGYEGYYSVNRRGDVYSEYSKRQITQVGEYREHYADRKYVQLTVKGKAKRVSVSTLVAMTFIPNPDNKEYVDHINRHATDNRVENLRWATFNENMANKGKNQKGKYTSKYKGVCYSKEYRNWHGQFYHNKKRIWLGVFQTEIEAAMAYNEMIKKFRPEFGVLNIIPSLNEATELPR